MSKFLKINLAKIKPEAIKEAARCLKKGGLIAYPTETTYALATILKKESLERLFILKGRKKGKPVSVLVKNLRMAKRLASFSPLAEKIWKNFLPGPLTLVLPQKKSLPKEIGSTKTIGLRYPFLG